MVLTNGSSGNCNARTLAGPPGSGMVCINGAAAHLVHRGDLVILCTYAQMTPQEAETYEPTVVLVDERNRVRQISKYRAGLLVTHS